MSSGGCRPRVSAGSRDLACAVPSPQHQHQHQHAAASIYATPAAGHQQTSYETPPGAEAYSAFVAGVQVQGQLPTPGPGQDGNLDIWHTVPSGYEYVFSGPGARVEDWLIGGLDRIG
jgi:hypothetical protein